MAKSSTIIIVLLLVIIILGGATVVLFGTGFLKFGGSSEPVVSSGGSGLVIDKNAGDYVAPTVEQVNRPNVAVRGFTKLTIPSGRSTGITVDFCNPESNAGNYYQTFKLVLDSGEVLYESGLVEPGKHIQTIALSRSLEPGTYGASVFVQPYTMDESLTPLNNANLKISLVVV